MANSNGWGDGAANNLIGWGQGADNAIGWGDSHIKSWAGATDIVGFDSSAISYFNATGITGATQQDAIDNLVKSLKDYGIWSKMKAVYPFVTDNKNVIEYTEDFNNAYWSKVSATISSNATTAPNGTLTADLFTSTATYGRYRTTNVPRNQAATYTFSCYIKGVSGVAAIGSIVVNVGVGFTIATDGTVTVNAPVGISSAQNLQVSNVGNGWYRVSGTATYTTSADDFQIWSSNSGSSFYVWGAQLELGSTATSYQPIATTQQAFISDQFKYNLKDPRDTGEAFRLVFNGGWTFSKDGATPNGVNGYADTKLNQSSNLTNDSVHLSYYSRTNSSVGSYDIGGNSGSPNFFGAQLACYYFGIGAIGHLHSYPTDSTVSTASTDTRAFYLASRTSSTSSKLFRNSTLLATNTTSRTSTLASVSFRLASDLSVNYSNRQCAFASIGDGLTDTEAANLYSRIQNFQTALSRQV